MGPCFRGMDEFNPKNSYYTMTHRLLLVKSENFHVATSKACLRELLKTTVPCAR